MADRFIDLIRLLKPLNKKQKEGLDEISTCVEAEDSEEIKKLLKQGKISFVESRLKATRKVADSGCFYTLNADTSDKNISEYVSKMNEQITRKVEHRNFKSFSKKAQEIIQEYIGINIEGFEIIKKAIALQLFATERVHILLLGDPGTGKTDMLRDATSLHPISSFGLGSGTTGAGLSITVKGKEVTKGLLPLADGGVCAIDELNLMESKERASLYNAMEKGFVTYDKAGSHYKFDARVRVLSTANPKGDKFSGKDIDALKKQLPFDPALLSRFHLVFLIRKPDIKQFMNITKSIIRRKTTDKNKDEEFIREYVSYAEKIEVTVPKEFENEIMQFVEEIKKHEDKYLIEVSPRLVLGFLRLAMASARMRLESKVKKEDIELVKKIINEGLKTE
ncbi:MAG: ATP-binding protein [Nanoarchaeota archaeon]